MVLEVPKETSTDFRTVFLRGQTPKTVSNLQTIMSENSMQQKKYPVRQKALELKHIDS